MAHILWVGQMLEQSVKATYCWVMKQVGGAGKGRSTLNIIYRDVTLLFMNKK